MNKINSILCMIIRYLSALALGYYLYETIDEGWVGNGKWCIAWAILLVLATALEIHFEKRAKADPPKKITPKTRVKFLDRCKAAITAFRHPSSNAIFREVLLATDRPSPVSKKMLTVQSPHVKAWLQCDSSAGPSEDDKARLKKSTMHELVDVLEPYIIVRDYTDPIDCIYRLMVELKVVDPNG